MRSGRKFKELSENSRIGPKLNFSKIIIITFRTTVVQTTSKANQYCVRICVQALQEYIISAFSCNIV